MTMGACPQNVCADESQSNECVQGVCTCQDRPREESSSLPSTCTADHQCTGKSCKARCVQGHCECSKTSLSTVSTKRSHTHNSLSGETSTTQDHGTSHGQSSHTLTPDLSLVLTTGPSGIDSKTLTKYRNYTNSATDTKTPLVAAISTAATEKKMAIATTGDCFSAKNASCFAMSASQTPAVSSHRAPVQNSSTRKNGTMSQNLSISQAVHSQEGVTEPTPTGPFPTQKDGSTPVTRGTTPMVLLTTLPTEASTQIISDQITDGFLTTTTSDGSDEPTVVPVIVPWSGPPIVVSLASFRRSILA